MGLIIQMSLRIEYSSESALSNLLWQLCKLLFSFNNYRNLIILNTSGNELSMLQPAVVFKADR